MSRTAHSKRPKSLKNKQNRHELAKAVEKIHLKGYSILEIERTCGMPIGTTANILQGRARVDQSIVVLYNAISNNISLLREIELMWEGLSSEEIAVQMVHES